MHKSLFLFPSHFSQFIKEHFSQINLLSLSLGIKYPVLHCSHFFPLLSQIKQSSPQEISGSITIVVSSFFKSHFIILFLSLYVGTYPLLHFVHLSLFLFPSHFSQFIKEHSLQFNLLLLSFAMKYPALHFVHFFFVVSHSIQLSSHDISIFKLLVGLTLLKTHLIISLLSLYSGLKPSMHLVQISLFFFPSHLSQFDKVQWKQL